MQYTTGQAFGIIYYIEFIFKVRGEKECLNLFQKN